jgi:hypothetical protein
MTLTESSRKGDGFAQFRQMYLWELKRSRVLSAVYAALTLLCYSVVFICQAVSTHAEYFAPHSELAEELSKEELAESFSNALVGIFHVDASLTLVPLAMLFVAVFCVVTFGYMHNRRSVDLFHSLPVRRAPLLLAGMAAGYTVLAAVVTVSMVICYIAVAALGATADFPFPLLLGNLGFLLLTIAAAMALTTTLLVCSGTVLNAVISGLVLMGGWPMLCLCACAIISSTLPGSTLSPSFAASTWFVPWLAGLIPFGGTGLNALMGVAAPVVTAEGASQSEPLFSFNAVTVLWWVLFTAVMLAAAVLIYQRRGSEQAENNFSFPPLRMVIQFLVACAVGLAAGLIFGSIFNSNPAFFLAVLVFSAAAHAVAQIIWVRGVRQFKRSLPTYGAAVLALCAFFVILATGGLGYVHRIPAVGQVESVEVSLPQYHYDDSAKSYLAEKCRELYVAADRKATETVDGEKSTYTNQYFYTDLHPRLTDAKSVETVQGLHRTILSEKKPPYLPCHKSEYGQCVLNYSLKNGRTLSRVYDLPDGEMVYYEKENVTVYAGDNSMELPEEEGERRTASPEVLKKMAEVVALDQYQACNLTPYLTGKEMSNITCALVSEDKNSVEIVENYSRREGLTAKQKEKVWKTFLKELNSPDFVYTYEDEFGVQDDMGRYNDDYYRIEMDAQIPSAQWSQKLRKMLERCSVQPWEGVKLEEMYCDCSNIGYYVPKCCPKTRKLMRKYTEGQRVREVFNEKEGYYMDPNERDEYAEEFEYDDATPAREGDLSETSHGQS